MNFARSVFVVWVALMTGFVATSCKRSASSSTPYTALEFRVDSARLGANLTEGAVTLRVPAGWMSADSATLEQARVAGRADTSQFSSEVSAVFLDTTNGAVMIARRHQGGINVGFSDWGRALLDRFRASRPGWNIQEDWILINSIQTLQIHAMDSIRVYFSFLLDQNPPLQLDYIVPSPAWERMMPSIESSLGTIQVISK